MTWKLAKSVAFSEVEDTLLKLKRRISEQGKVIREFYVDICCSWRSKLQKVFGEDLKVFLDIFHAVKRISSTIPKKHPLHYRCIRALSMVFRDPTDQGNERQKPTPPPAVMLANIESFQTQWSNIIFSTATHQEISNLRKHIEKGCLSGIKPGRGTNKNEALHKSLNGHLKSSRYGVELASMLLTTSFYRHNEKIDAQSCQRPCKLVMEHMDHLQAKPLTDELFGIIPAGHERVAPITSCAEPGLEQLSFGKNSYHELLVRFTSEASFFMLHEGPDTFEGDMQTSIPIDDGIAILVRAMSWFAVYSTVSKYASTANIECTDIPFMKAKFGCSLCWFGTDLDTSDRSAHKGRLSNALASWNFRQVEVPGDGNCLFTAVALHLQLIGQEPASPLHPILERLGIDVSSDSVQHIAKLLRRAVVTEWLGEHSTEYTGFLASAQLEKEAQTFLNSGEFAGELGDLVVSALSNVLQSPIVLFTSIANLPILVVTPSHTIMENPQPIHLSFTQYGPGHYDMAIYQDSNSSAAASQDIQESHQCTCGRKKNLSGAACTTIMNKYASRCPCYNEKRSCTESCKCKNCKNPFGCFRKDSPMIGNKRKRRHHDTQQFPIRGVKSTKFMEDSKIEYGVGSPTTFERLLVFSIIHYLAGSDIPSNDQLHHISFIFSYIKNIATALGVLLPLFQRSLDEISKMIRSYMSKK